LILPLKLKSMFFPIVIIFTVNLITLMNLIIFIIQIIIFIIILYLLMFKWVWLQYQAHKLWAPLKCQTQEPWVWLQRRTRYTCVRTPDPFALDLDDWPTYLGPSGAARPKGLGFALLLLSSNLGQVHFSSPKFFGFGRGCQT